MKTTSETAELPPSRSHLLIDQDTISQETKDLIEVAIGAYPLPITQLDADDTDTIIENAESDGHGDTLVTFIVRELLNTVPHSKKPFETGAYAIEQAAKQLLAVAAGLRDKA